MIAPIPLGEDDDTNRETWAEHQRRQRSIRVLMMFLMMLILMDGEEPHNRKMLFEGERRKLVRIAAWMKNYGKREGN